MNEDYTKKYEIISTPLITNNFCPLYTHKIRYLLPDGVWSNWHIRECVNRPDAVVVVPFDPISKKVVFVEQFRIGAIDKTDTPWLWEIVAGLIEPKESPETTAIREVKEEIGLNVINLLPLLQCLTSPGYSNERAYFYLATVDASKLDVRGGNIEENEYLYLHTLSLDETFRRLKSNFFKNSSTIIALQTLQNNNILKNIL